MGGTVSVLPGIYREAIYINKTLSLIGIGTPTITARGLGDTNTTDTNFNDVVQIKSVNSVSRVSTVRLTTDPACDRQPAWSPDGTIIAFVSNCIGRTDGYDLFAISPDGTNEWLLAQFTVTDPYGWRFAEPSWLGTSGDLLLGDHKWYHEIMRFYLSQAKQDNALPVERSVRDGDSQYIKRLLFVPGGQGGHSPVTFNGSQIAWAARIDCWVAVPPAQRRHEEGMK